jgi:ABC-type Fe3+-siderophore transport system permease subunit
VKHERRTTELEDAAASIFAFALFGSVFAGFVFLIVSNFSGWPPVAVWLVSIATGALAGSLAASLEFGRRIAKVVYEFFTVGIYWVLAGLAFWR